MPSIWLVRDRPQAGKAHVVGKTTTAVANAREGATATMVGEAKLVLSGREMAQDAYHWSAILKKRYALG